MTDFAPGLPDPSVSHEIRPTEKHETWDYVLQEHQAEKRGLHHDLRLGDPKTGHGHSWAIPPEWPKPGTEDRKSVV